MSQTMKAAELIPHPRNTEFFDDIVGDAWEEFKKSIAAGIVEPLVISQDRVIISGHQRRRAALELGIEEVQVEVRIFKDEDEALKALIETNIRQRGVGNPNPVKMGKCLKELERIYGIRDGSAGGTGANQYKELEPKVSAQAKTQEELARELGMSRDTLQNYKKLADAIPEVQELLEAGKVRPSTALKMIKRLDPTEQAAMAAELAKLPGMATAKDVEKLQKQLAETEAAKTTREKFEIRRAERLQAELEELKARPPREVVVEKVVEKEPPDYRQLQMDLEAERAAHAGTKDLNQGYLRITVDQKRQLEAKEEELNEAEAARKAAEDELAGYRARGEEREGALLFHALFGTLQGRLVDLIRVQSDFQRFLDGPQGEVYRSELKGLCAEMDACADALARLHKAALAAAQKESCLLYGR